MQPPRERLKEIVRRSGMSGSQIARELGYASPPGFLRYTQDKQGDQPIPFPVIKKLIPLVRGRGNPPITTEELMALTDAKELPKRVEQALVHVVEDVDGFLVVRHRIESGVFVELDHARSLGSARIGVSKEYPAAAQFVVALSEDIRNVGKVGSQLHCVTPNQFGPAQMHGRRVVVAVPRAGAPDLVSLRTGIVDQRNHLPRIHDDEGAPADGDIIGVVVGIYSRI